MGTSISNINSLLRLPTGCGEQTMAGMAPDIMIANYLQSKGMFSGSIKDTLIRYMETGYQRELTYQQSDGSFGIWIYSQGSTWLGSSFIHIQVNYSFPKQVFYYPYPYWRIL